MPIPDYQSLMRPLLEEVADGREHSTLELVRRLADRSGLSEAERAELLPSGRQPVIVNRTLWAIAKLHRAKLLERPQRAQYRITGRGREALASGPERIDIRWLSQFPEFQPLRADKQSSQGQDEAALPASATPDEVLRAAHAQIDAKLRADLLDLILKGDAAFFERLIGKLALALGYGGGRPEAVRVIGRGGDRGIDVEIDEDALGLDKLLLQAKRYVPGSNVGDGEVRDFAGALRLRNATKGVIATTSAFTAAARASAERLGIVLIDGDQLASLMIRFDVGVRIEATFHVKRIDADFFDGE
jgi:restriction system protein